MARQLSIWLRYYTIRIPHTANGATEWHPTRAGEVLSRGAFKTREEARAWARAKLGNAPWSIVLIACVVPTAQIGNV